MVRGQWRRSVRQFLDTAARRGRRSGHRPDRRPQLYRPWFEILEGRLAPTVTLSISNPAPFPKPDTGQMTGMFVVTRSGDLEAPILVDYTTQDGSGAQGAHAGIDYAATAGTLVFAPYQITATVTVPILGNNIFQADKTFTVSLSNPRPGAYFAPQRSFAIDTHPECVAVGDFNGDGRPDLAVINNPSYHQPGTMSVLLNTTPAGATTPSFTPQQTFATGYYPSSVAVGDFNGDGKPDLAVTNLASGTVSVLLNTTPVGATAPSFMPQQTFATGTRLVSVAVGDFNGDGKPDLAVANSDSRSVSVLLNTTPAGATTLSFAPQQTFTTGRYPGPVVVADFNGDGKPDLAVGINDRTTHTVAVLLNTTPAGATIPSFAAQQTFATVGFPSNLAVGDFNGDGKPDLAIASFTTNSTVAVLLNTTPTGATIPSFAPNRAIATTQSPDSIVVGDFNDDGKPDLALANYQSSTVSILLDMTALGSTVPNFTPAQTFATGHGPSAIAVGDFNGDGKPDLAVANDIGNDGHPTGMVSVFLNIPAPITLAPSFAPQQTFAGGDRPVALAVGDFNGDSKPDLVASSASNGTVSVLLNTTPSGATIPSFTPQQTFAVGSESYSVAVGDFNGDGKPDLVVTSSINTVSVLLNTTPRGATTPSFAPQATFASGTIGNGFSVAVADFTGDGKPDIAIADHFDNTVSVLVNTTPLGATIPSFAPRQTFASGRLPTALAVGDFNGDGKPDLAVVTPDDTLVVLLNTTPAGATIPSFAPQQTFAIGGLPYSVVVDDFNGDDKLDLAVTNTYDNTVSVLLNTTPVGATIPSFAPQLTFSTGYHPLGMAVGDFTGDGKTDLAITDGGDNTVSVLRNTTPVGATAPSFALRQPFATSFYPIGLAMTDFNGDGKPDLAVGSNGSRAISVLMNAAPILLVGSPSTGTVSSALEAPTTLAVVGGSTPQSGVVNTAFAVPLAVDVRDAAGYAVQGVSVTFTAPGSGASGSFGGSASVTVVTNASGRATAPAFLANTIAGGYRVAAQASGGSNPSTNFSLTNAPAAATSFTLTDLPPNLVAGTATDFTIIAHDPFNNIATGYAGTVHFLSTDPNAALPDDYTFTAADQGSHTFAGLILQSAGIDFVLAYDTADHRIAGTSSGVTVVAAAADHFTVTTTATDPDMAGTPFDVTVTVQDVYGNTVTDYTGTVTFSSADPYGATLPADYTFQPGDQGTATFPGGATLYTAGTWDVTATDTSSGITGSAFVNVVATPAAAFQVVAPTNVVSGTPFDVTVIAVDPYGNTDTNYQGTITFSTSDSDPGVVLPPDYTFQPSDAGMATFPGGITLIPPGDQLLTVTDVDSGIAGSSTVTVEAGGVAPGAGRFRPGATAFWLPSATTPTASEPAIIPPRMPIESLEWSVAAVGVEGTAAHDDRVTVDWLLRDGANPLLSDPLAEVLAPALCGTSSPTMDGDAVTP